MPSSLDETDWMLVTQKQQLRSLPQTLHETHDVSAFPGAACIIYDRSVMNLVQSQKLARTNGGST